MNAVFAGMFAGEAMIVEWSFAPCPFESVQGAALVTEESDADANPLGDRVMAN